MAGARHYEGMLHWLWRWIARLNERPALCKLCKRVPPADNDYLCDDCGVFMQAW